MERFVFEFAFRVSLIFLTTALVLRALRIGIAAAQHAVWAGVLMVMLALPVWMAWGPRTTLPVLPARAETGVVVNAAPASPVVVGSVQGHITPPIPAPWEISEVPQTQPSVWNWSAILIGTYLLGACVLLLRLAIGTIGANRLTGASCVVPVTVGLLRPRVILPERCSAWPQLQLDAVLTHERAHARRHDPLFQWLALLNRAVFWFHPLAWWLERRLSALAEEACDAAVLERGHDPRDYSEYLLDLARAVQRAGTRVNELGMAMPGSHLPHRIRKMIDGVEAPRISPMRMACAVLACTIPVVVFAAGTLERAPRILPLPLPVMPLPQPPVLLAQASATPQQTPAPARPTETAPAPRPATPRVLEATAGVADITGTWQGTLQAGRELRTVFKVSKADGDALKAVLYSIDQRGLGMPSSPVALQGSSVKISIPGIGGTYEGKLNADATSITGTWTRNAGPRPLTLKRATSETAWTIPDPPAGPKPMAADADPVFEVAMMQPSGPEAQGRGFRVNGHRFSTTNTSLRDLMTFAYGLNASQIMGGPAWLESEKFDLVAQSDPREGQPNDPQWKMMVQKLMADRFQLNFHRENKELSVYAIVPGKTGPKLTRSEGDPNGLPGLFFRGLGVLPASNATMADFAGVMQTAVLDRPVVDRTGLPGRYDFTLTWTPDEFQFRGLGARVSPPPGKAAPPPDLFTAIQEQLGLKLESTRALAGILVIDHVERPSEN